MCGAGCASLLGQRLAGGRFNQNDAGFQRGAHGDVFRRLILRNWGVIRTRSSGTSILRHELLALSRRRWTGDEGPSLHNLSISNARIAATIKKGIKGEMPTFAKKYDDTQIAALVSYLRSLR